MKKIFIIVMITLTLGVTGCGNKTTENSKNLNNRNTSNVTQNENGKDKEKEEQKNKDGASESSQEIRNALKEAVDKIENEGFFKYNLNLVYRENGTYKYSELKDSKQVTDGDGYKFEGDFYSNKFGAIETVLAFNKLWIEYVNQGNTNLFSRVKKDSEAYEDIMKFNKNGLTENFKTVEIGEVRNYNDFYYVWTHEVIEELRNGEITLREYNWIYKLKKEEMDFYIVAFTGDKV